MAILRPLQDNEPLVKFLAALFMSKKLDEEQLFFDALKHTLGFPQVHILIYQARKVGTWRILVLVL